MRTSEQEANDILKEAFKTENFWIGSSVDENKDAVIISYWYAFTYFVPYSRTLVAVVNSKQWKKGVVFIPDITVHDLPQP